MPRKRLNSACSAFAVALHLMCAAAAQAAPHPSVPSPAAVLSLSRAGAVPAAPGDLRAAADNKSAESHPERAALLEALAFAFLSGKNYDSALSTAREALSVHARWKQDAGQRVSWDGTGDGSVLAWRSLAAAFPYDEDAGGFLAAGRRFLSASALHEYHREIEAANRELSRRVAAAKEGLALSGKRLDDIARRAEEIRTNAQAGKTRVEGMRGRLRRASDTLPLSAWGAKTDPRRAALIEEADRRFRELGGRIARAGAAADAAADMEQGILLPPEDRRMLFYAQRRISSLQDSLHALEGRAAVRKAAIWNAWKAAYVSRLSAQMDGAESAAKALAGVASRAEMSLTRFRKAHEEIAAWGAALDRFRKRLADGSFLLAKRRAEAKAISDRELSRAGRDLLAAIVRGECQVRYLAARAATEWRAQERRPELLAEAIRHWEAVLSCQGERNLFTDEALYALGELRFEEAESRYLQKEDVPEWSPDFSVPISLFRKVIDDHPDSPYREQASYGLALSFQEAGAAENAVASMKALLARHPRTRFADELHLRLGEYAFDESDYTGAEKYYRNVSAGAAPEIRVTALFKLGWSLFLQGRSGEAIEPFLSALLLSRDARRTGGVPGEALAMAARSLVESNLESEAESLLAQRNGSSEGPALLLRIQSLLETQNRYAEAARIADRMGKSYPMAAERVDAELAAAEALRKAGKDDESHSRKGKFHGIFGPGSAWRAAPGRAPREAERADAVSEEAMRVAAFYFHAQSRRSSPGDRPAILALYDAHIAFYPSSPKAEEIEYQRAWLLFEDGRKREAATAFETVALRPGGTRGESSWYMALQSEKDISSPSDAASQAEIVRLAREYERFFRRGERIFPVLMDRARAHANLRQFAQAAETAEAAAGISAAPAEHRAALRLGGDARFEKEDFMEAEKAFRALLRSAPTPEEAGDAGKWIGFSLFRRAEKMEQEKPSEAADLFAQVDREFPFLEIAPVARFRAGTAHAAAGKYTEAIAVLLAVESAMGESAISLDASRWLARLYEKSGNPAAAGERHERLATAGGSPREEAVRNLLRAADLFSAGKDEARARKNLRAVASLPGVPPDLRVQCHFRAAESARGEGRLKEADGHYEEAVAAHLDAPEAAPTVAGMALFRRAEHRFLGYRELSIAPPLAKTFPAKQAALEESAKLYVEAIRLGDEQTVSASLHRLGEAFEDFRSAILSSSPPRGLSDREREEYAFLLEEKAAPIEDRAVEAYLRNLRQAVVADYRSEWVEKSLQRLKTLRPARFGKKGEYAFPVLTVPVFRGIIVKKAYEEAIARTRGAVSRGAGKEAMPLWKALEGSPWDADAIFHQGVLLHLDQDFDGAAAHYRRLSDRSPVHEPAAANLIGIHLLRGEWKEAGELADRFLPAGAGLPAGMLPELAANVAATLVERGNHDRAAMLLLAMRARGISAPSLSWSLAVLAHRNGNAEAARRLAAEVPPDTAGLFPVVASRFAWDRESAAIPPMDNVPAAGRRMASLAVNLAAFEEYRKGNPAAAESLLTRRPEDAEFFPEILANAGLLQTERGKWKDARASLEKTVRAKPEMPEGWINLGLFKEIYEGNAAEAIECYMRYVKLNGPRKDEARQWIEWLEKSPPLRQ